MKKENGEFKFPGRNCVDERKIYFRFVVGWEARNLKLSVGSHERGKMYNESEIVWSDESYSLKKLIKEFSLPQLVMVDEGYMLDETESLSSGQLITVQGHESITQFKGTDSEGKVIILPVKCPFKVKLVAEEEGKLFKGLKDLCNSLGRPKYVEVRGSRIKRDLGLVKNGDRLKILLTERGPDGPNYLHVRNQRGKHLRLPVDFNCDFRACAEDGNEHLLFDLISKDLPLFIKFIDSRNIGESIGIIKLNECIRDTLVFASTKHQGRLFATAFPMSLDVKVRTVKELPKTESCKNEEVRDAMDEIDVNKFCEYMARDSTLRGSGYVYFAPFDQIKDESSDDKKSEPIIEHVDKNEYETPVNTACNKPRKSKGFLSRVRSKFLITKSSHRKTQETRPEIVIMDNQCGASSDGGGSRIYEQIPGDTYVSMDIMDGVRRTLNTSTPIKSSVKKRSISRAQSSAIPPPLPGNHPLERRHTYNAKSRAQVRQGLSSERDNFKKFYDTLKRSEQEIIHYDLERVGVILKQLKMEKHVKKFIDNQIDGKLLVDLDEAVFKDIGLSPFEARKLRKYVFGWRPDKAKVDVNYSSNSADDNEAVRWSESQVAEHLTNLGLHEFRRFCELNQVNGDLLWDMVVDEEIIYGLLVGSDRRLNAVKLKNYVTEGWRPKMMIKRSNSINSGTIDKRTSGKGKSVTDDRMVGSVKKSAETRVLGAQRKLMSADSTADVTKQCRSASVSDNTSPVSSSSLTSKNVSRPKSRQAAKVSYPKSSPYAKSSLPGASEPVSSQQTCVAVKQEKIKTEQLQESGTSSKQARLRATTSTEKTRKNPTTDRKISPSGVAGSSKGTRNSVSTANKVDKPSICEEKTSSTKGRRGFNFRGKATTNVAASKKGSAMVKGSKVKEETNIVDAKTGSYSVALRSKATDKKKTNDIDSSPREGLQALQVKAPPNRYESSPKHSPLIANLRKQYEQNDDDIDVKFRKSDKIKNTGRSELRMAIKRKESNNKNEEIDKPIQSISSVAKLKKQFDRKPVL
eukprot:gene12696-13998_t